MFKNLLKPIFFSKIRNYSLPQSISQDWESINIPHNRGNYLASRLYRCHKSTNRCVFLIHPYHKDAKDFFLQSGHPEIYNTLGFHVVIFDFNGFGQSPNIGFDFDQDIVTVVEYMMGYLGTTFHVAHGISFGAAMLLKALTHNTGIQKAIIENCLDETPNYYNKRNIYLYIIMKAIFFLFPAWKASNQYYDVIKNIKDIEELCLIYNIADDLTTPEMGTKLLQHAIVNCQFHLLKGRHMEAISADRKKYIDILESYVC